MSAMLKLCNKQKMNQMKIRSRNIGKQAEIFTKHITKMKRDYYHMGKELKEKVLKKLVYTNTINEETAEAIRLTGKMPEGLKVTIEGKTITANFII